MEGEAAPPADATPTAQARPSPEEKKKEIVAVLEFAERAYFEVSATELPTAERQLCRHQLAFIQHLLRCANIAEPSNNVLTSFINSSSNLGLKTPKSTEGNDRTTTKKLDPKTSRHKFVRLRISASGGLSPDYSKLKQDEIASAVSFAQPELQAIFAAAGAGAAGAATPTTTTQPPQPSPLARFPSLCSPLAGGGACGMPATTGGGGTPLLPMPHLGGDPQQWQLAPGASGQPPQQPPEQLAPPVSTSHVLDTTPSSEIFEALRRRLAECGIHDAEVHRLLELAASWQLFASEMLTTGVDVDHGQRLLLPELTDSMPPGADGSPQVELRVENVKEGDHKLKILLQEPARGGFIVVKRVLSFHLPGPVEPNSVYTEQWNEEECTCTLTFPITPPAPPDPGEYLSSGPGGSVPLAAAAAIEEPSGCGAGVGSGVHGSSASALEGSDQVLEYFKQFGDHSEAGCAIAQCHEAMAASGVSLEQIRNQVNQLVSDGHLYSTIDDDHYKGI